jgi:hypothetical protein
MEHIELGSTPFGESCAQVGSENYYEKSKEEIARYIKQLKELIEVKFGKDSDKVRLRSKSFSHDFGTYNEVIVSFDENDNKASEIAYWLEENLPEHWSC